MKYKVGDRAWFRMECRKQAVASTVTELHSSGFPYTIKLNGCGTEISANEHELTELVDVGTWPFDNGRTGP